MLITETKEQPVPLKLRGKKLGAFEAEVVKQQGADAVFPVHDSKGQVKWVSLPHKHFEFYGCLSSKLPAGVYHFENIEESLLEKAALAFMLGAYKFDKFQSKKSDSKVKILVPQKIHDAVQPVLEATYLARDLINTPANHLGPREFEAKAKEILKSFKIPFEVIEGKALEEGYPLVHTVGKAASSDRAPRILIAQHKPQRAEKHIALVGKGVCFDTGGLNLKNDSGMYNMKKDMGGAALMLGLAQLLLAKNVNVSFTLLLPLVENAIGSHAMRPLDIIKSRKGDTVEIGNTDAEGRLILADALTRACEEKPDLIIDAATLTGAARVALGADVPAYFTNTTWVKDNIDRCSEQEGEPLWQLPLYQPYKEQLRSKHADINNISGGSLGGAITAALFLENFIEFSTPWLHIDFMAWNLKSSSMRPEGGEAMVLRTLYRFIESL